MATEDLIPQLLATVYNKALPPPPTDNEALNLFTAPVDGIAIQDVVTTTVVTYPNPYSYGNAPFAYAGPGAYGA